MNYFLLLLFLGGILQCLFSPTSAAVAPSHLNGDDTKVAKKILFLLPMCSKSHRNVFEPLIQAMAKLNHEVVVVSAYPSSKNVSNIRELNPTDFAVQMEEFQDPIKTRREGSGGFVTKIIAKILDAGEQLFKNKEFMDLLNEKFDLVYLNAFWNELMYAIPYKLNAPFLIVSTMAVPSHVSIFLGNRLPPSFVPGFTGPYTDSMTFLERLNNLLTTSMMEIYLDFTYVKQVESIHHKYLGSDVPQLSFLMSEASGVLSNSHFSLTYPRPTLPNVIEVGGMHCNTATKPLPKEIEDFIGEAKDGFIYFSFGSIVRANTMPENLRKIFVNVFSRLKNLRVLWKFETGEMADLPKNVKLLKWAPQQDILSHKNIRIFITHGGLLSTQEAAYYGVPLVGLPLFADQDLNMKQAMGAGNALTLEILELTEQSLERTIERILTEKKFTDRAKELSSVFRDQTETPLERAVYWSEYMLRHKGAPYIRSAARHLNFFQYHSLDVIATLSLVLALVLWTLKIFFFFLFRKIFSGKGNKEKVKRQ